MTRAAQAHRPANEVLKRRSVKRLALRRYARRILVTAMLVIPTNCILRHRHHDVSNLMTSNS